MNLQLSKELRALLLPWSVAAGAAVLLPLANFLAAAHWMDGGTFFEFVLGNVMFAFFTGLLAVAALPFGTEFQCRTLPLLLSQPIARSRMWKDKLVAGSLSIGIALLLLVLFSFLAQQVFPSVFRIVVSKPPGVTSEGEIALAACALLLPTLGSAGYWTLVAGSTLGGMVFTASAQLVVAGLLGFAAERLGLSVPVQVAGVVAASCIYGAFFFWLTWRKISQLEVAQEGGTGSKSLVARGWRLDWLRCRPTTALLNLVRKEIQLQKPLFIIAGIVCAFWLLSYTLLILQPSRTNFAEVVFALTIGFYIPLTALLAGTVTLGEEKYLGLPAWSLTLPISIRRQWAVKLASGFLTWVILGLVLPFALSHLGGAISGLRAFNEMDPDSWLTFGLFTTALYAISFWAMTLFSNMVRAIIASIGMMALLCGAVALAVWIVIQLGPGTFASDERWEKAASIGLGAMAVLLALIQSLVQFRRLQTSWKTVVKSSCTLIAFTFIEVFVYFLF